MPGIDFSNDPLLQGRLFSYLDTQLIRLGGPNFNELPVNQPKCPWANLQRDGHTRMRVSKGRVNYEPNTLALEAPRADPKRGFTGLMRPENGGTMRIRPESFADHYSQARMFFLSQTEAEKNHIVAALVFELSKVETPSVREGVVSHLMHVDEAMARRVAAGLRLGSGIEPARQRYRRNAKWRNAKWRNAKWRNAKWRNAKRRNAKWRNAKSNPRPRSA